MRKPIPISPAQSADPATASCSFPAPDALLDEQSQRWQSGERVLVEALLERTAELKGNMQAVLDLIYHEIVLRERAGEQPGLAEYLQRFPQHAEQIRDQFAVHGALGSMPTAASGDGNMPNARAAGAAATPPESMLTAEQACALAAHARAAGNVACGPTEDDSLPAGTDAPVRLPDRIGRYLIRKLLGQGGMGRVYQAHDPQLHRLVALKVPHFDGSAQEQILARKRFVREARAAAALRHPHVCPIYDVGEHDGLPYVVMAFIEGQSLAGRLKTQGRFEDPRQAVELVRQVVEGLSAVHEHGLLHRDLKPGNILLDESGHALLADFGLARPQDDTDPLTRTGGLVGTLAYMAPEQIDPRKGTADQRSDLYSLGVVLFQLLTGRLPFEGSSITLLRQIADQPPPPPSQFRPDLDPVLEGLLLKTMAHSPEDRFPSAATLAQALAGWLQGNSPTIAFPGSPPQDRVQPAVVAKRLWGRRTLLAMALALFGVASAAVLAVVLPWWRSESPPPPTLDTRPPPVYSGFIDVQVTEKGNPSRQLVWLRDPVARPLKLNDEVRVEAHVNEAAYLYILWTDTTGKTQPIYPWLEGDWKKRPIQEAKVMHLSLPEQTGKVWEIDPGAPGMETLALLARPTPLPLDISLEQVLGQLEVPPLADPRDVAWFDNGTPPKNERDRAPNLKKTVDANNPIMRQQAQLWEKLRTHFPYMTTVTFANKGG